MPRSIEIKGTNLVDTEARYEALSFLNTATTSELTKLVKAAKNPVYRAMLKKL